MQNYFGYKLVAVLDMNTLKLFKAEGLKITEGIGIFQLHENEERNVERHESLRINRSGLSAFHDPHTSKKDIDLFGFFSFHVFLYLSFNTIRDQAIRIKKMIHTI